MPPYPKLKFDHLCVDMINAVLGTELEPGPVILSTQAHRHIATDHAEDYAACLAALADALAFPTFIGQGPRADNFEVVRRINHLEGKAVLVAVSLTVDDDGAYRVRSSYLIPQWKVDDRRRAGHLKTPPAR
jgi:hypothetical protein